MTPTKSPTKPSKSLGIQLRRDIGLYTVEDMCALLDVSAHTLMSWRNSGDGPVFTYLGGRRIYYRREDVIHWVDNGLVRADFADKLPEQPPVQSPVSSPRDPWKGTVHEQRS
jgi:hypothetical protein